MNDQLKLVVLTKEILDSINALGHYRDELLDKDGQPNDLTLSLLSDLDRVQLQDVTQSFMRSFKIPLTRLTSLDTAENTSSCVFKNVSVTKWVNEEERIAIKRHMYPSGDLGDTYVSEICQVDPIGNNIVVLVVNKTNDINQQWNFCTDVGRNKELGWDIAERLHAHGMALKEFMTTPARHGLVC